VNKGIMDTKHTVKARSIKEELTLKGETKLKVPKGVTGGLYVQSGF